ncbi:hypothetical protein IAD21_02889 [Abditibacteriota bacterium]|nr:hypothetical protein IAD21_02889 [Abditibacteriota bacterium]
MQPPQNPYNQPNYGQPGGYGSQQPRGTVSLDVIGEAWNLVKPSLGQWIVAMLIAGAGAAIVSFVSQMLQRPFTPTPGSSPSMAFWAITFITQIIGFVVNTAIAAGLIKMAIAQVRTGVASFNEMFSVTNIIGPILVAAILTGLVTYVGILLCIVPGIIAALGLCMTQPLVVDQNMGAVDAMKRSWEIMKPHLGSTFVLFLVLGLLNCAGLIACCVGILVTYPICIVAIALVYRDMFGIGGAGGQSMGYTPPPIANPNF